MHDQLTQLTRENFAFTQREQFLPDMLNGLIHQLGGHRALVQGAPEALAQLFFRKLLAEAAVLDDLRQADVRGFESGEALVAGQAATAAPHDVTVLVFTGVGDLRVVGAAEGAMHGRVRVPAVGA